MVKEIYKKGVFYLTRLIKNNKQEKNWLIDDISLFDINGV